MDKIRCLFVTQDFAQPGRRVVHQFLQFVGHLDGAADDEVFPHGATLLPIRPDGSSRRACAKFAFSSLRLSAFATILGPRCFSLT
jgi:hypothetical protein